MILFDQWSIDGRSGFKVQKCHLVADMKLKMSLFAHLTLSTSVWLPGVIFPLDFTLPIYGPLVRFLIHHELILKRSNET